MGWPLLRCFSTALAARRRSSVLARACVSACSALHASDDGFLGRGCSAACSSCVDANTLNGRGGEGGGAVPPAPDDGVSRPPRGIAPRGSDIVLCRASARKLEVGSIDKSSSVTLLDSTHLLLYRGMYNLILIPYE